MLFLKQIAFYKMLLAIIYYILFTLILWKWAVFHYPHLKNWCYPAVFSIKLLIAFVLWHTQIEYFADAYNYLDESAILNHVLYQSPIDYLKLLTGIGESDKLIHQYLSHTIHWTNSEIYNDAKNSIRFNAIISLFSFGKTYAHLVWITFIGVIGLKSIYDTLLIYVKNNKPYLLFLSILLLPTVTFWEASFLKESFLMLGFGLFFNACFGNPKLVKRIIYFAIGAFLLICIKPYVLICLLPAVGVVQLLQLKGKHRKTLVFGFLLLGIIASCILFQPNGKLTKTISRKQLDFINVGKGGAYFINDSSFYAFKANQMNHFKFINDKGYLKTSLEGEIIYFNSKARKKVRFEPNTIPWQSYYVAPKSGSYIEITPIDNSSWQLVKNIPQAFINVIFRPYPNDPPAKIEKWMIILETWTILILLIFAVLRKPKLSREQKNIAYSLVLFIVLLSLIIGWIVPVLGALIRYRLPITLVMVFLIWILFQPKKETTD